MPLPVTTYLDNTPTPAPPSQVGFKLSKPGYDAGRTSGSNFIFNSSWPSLPVAFQKSLTVAGVTSSILVPHGLSFTPFAMIWAYGPHPSGVGSVSRRFFASVDGTNVTVGIGSSIFDQNFMATVTKVNIKAFQLDLTQDIDYTLAPGDTFKMPYDNNYGVKVSLPNKDITSRDLRNFSVHSRAQSPLILAVKTEKTQNNTGSAFGVAVQYTTKYKFPVWYYGFVGNPTTGLYIPAPLYSQSFPRLFTDGFTGYLQYSSGPYSKGTIIVLRDPMFAATSTTVQY
jgi:hypothetical protein